MTTKLQYFTNPFSRDSLNNFSTNPFRVIQCYPEIVVGWYQVDSSMDKILETQKFEFLRRTMLMHGEIFKQQVQELHRLYSLQKNLMHELINGITSRNEIIAHIKNSNSEFVVMHSFGVGDDPSGSFSGENSRIPIKFDIERPSETTTSTLHLIEKQKKLKKIDEETELTLSIGNCTKKVKRSKSHFSHCSTKFKDFDEKVNEGEEYLEPSLGVSGSSSVSICQDNSRPHWLLQDLSLNRT